MNEIDHEFTDTVVCPYCGYKFSDCFEWSDDGREECEECYKEFTFDRNVTIDYSTSRICTCDHSESIHFADGTACRNSDYISGTTVKCPCKEFKEVSVKENK